VANVARRFPQLLVALAENRISLTVAGLLASRIDEGNVDEVLAPLRSSYLTVSAILLLTATVHPWYLLWIAPFLAIYASPAWLYLTLSVALAYHAAYLATPGRAWEDVVWVKLVEYAPFFVLAIASSWRERRAWRRLLGLNSPL
jgi:hypothetical protein